MLHCCRHERPPNAPASAHFPHKQIAYDKDALGTISVIALMMHQIAQRRAVPLRYQPPEGGVGAKTIAANAGGIEGERDLIAECSKVGVELPRHQRNRFGVTRDGRANA